MTAIPTPDSTPLAPGLRVKPWRHYLAPWDLAARVALHEGAAEVAGRLVPKGAPRPASAAELALLDGQAAPGEPALEVFTSPALLRLQFWSLDPDQLPSGPGDAAPSSAWQGFADEVRAFLKVARVPLPSAHALLLTVRDADDSGPGLWAGGVGRALLHGSGEDRSPGGEVPRAVWLNLSDVPTALVFFNLPLGAMAELLGGRAGGTGPRTDALAVLKAFVARFPRCPLVRLTLQPGDGVLVPLLGLAVDGDARDAPDLDVSLAVLPGPRQAAVAR